MGEVVAGWAAGYVMAVLTSLALVFLLVRARDSGAVRRWMGEGVNPLVISIPVSLGAFLAWTMAGLVIGSAYRLGNLDEQPGALGSPSAPFLLGMAAVAAMPIPLLLLFWRRLWWLWVGMAAAFVGLFGWFMPLMAGRF